MFDNFFRNCEKPKTSFGGRLMLKGMNKGHNAGCLWALSLIDLNQPIDNWLDIGCGGGQAIKNILTMTKETFVQGVDYSPASVEMTGNLNKIPFDSGRGSVTLGDARSLPFEDQSFQRASAFETVYFWPEIENCFKEVLRVLKPGGQFLVCNESESEEGNERWTKIMNMKIYTTDELALLMKGAGFIDIQKYKKDQGNWIAVTGSKPK